MATPVRSLADLDPDGTYTYADYLTWQFTELVELIRGKIVRRMSGPLDVHQAAASELHRIVSGYLYRKPCKVRFAPYDVRLTKRGGADTAVKTVVQPDICIICDASKIDARGCLGAPDWIIEILSPGTAARDWKDKFDLYEENGVGEYWIVAPREQTISAFVLDAATGRYRHAQEYAEPGPVPCHTLPELVMEWADVFPEAP